MASEKRDLVAFGRDIEISKSSERDGVYDALEDRIDLADFFDRLDRYSDKQCVKRVAHIAELLSTLDPRLTPETGQALMGLRRELNRYRWVVNVVPSTEGFTEIRRVPPELSDEGRWEHKAVLDLLKLLERGVFRIRRCADPACRAWFYLNGRSDQKYHHPDCKQHHYDENNREKKRAYMRKYAAEERRRRANPKNRVGLGTGKRTVRTATPRKKGS